MARARSATPDPVDGEFRASLRRRRWTVGDATAVLTAHRESGLSLAAFARRHRLSAQRLYDWHRRQVHATDTAASAPRFLPVRVVGSMPAAGTIEIVLRDDRRVRVSDEFDAATLTRVIEVLEHVGC